MPQDEKPFILALAATALVALYFVRYKKNVAPVPPGPRGLPHFGKCCRSAPIPAVDDVLSVGKNLRVLGKSIIVLNDADYAIDMLDKKSRIYSNRPNLVMGGELVGWDEGPALIQFGKKWSEYRRLMAQFLGTRSKIESAYSNIFEKTTHSFLHGILESPSNWKDHGYRFAGAIVLKIAYGYQAEDKDDPLVKLVDDAMNQFSELTATNAFAVDTFPFLRFVPQWLPGGGWKKKVVPYHTTLQTMLDTPYAWVKKQMEMGTSISCFVSDLLESSKFSSNDEERLVKWAAAGIYSGGAETTAAVIETFFLAMILQPDAQRKAQKELDVVLGFCTAPRLADRSRLPYMEALISENFRAYTIAPIGLPHVAAEEDVHNGFLIPKDSIILTNNWLFYRDPNIYADPETFRPERFIETTTHTKEKDPKDILFGYGRRACPGVHLADMSMWLLFASILAFFDISAPNVDGRSVLPSGKFLDGAISHPEQFECAIIPRQGAAEAIRRLLE
ncbi:Cytochrome P450 [Mycena venus]|uniref:Cytochrome P450 n=1 Tax=Mycena venus TaxID=2733690 RepID=A0A8H6Z492_9AGAR|nr:Cytochrome P450 [Mycena venus]